MLEIRGHKPLSREAKQRRKVMKRTLVACCVLLFILIAAGVGYVWYMGQQPLDEAATPAAPKVATKPVATERTIDPNAPIGIVLQSLSTPLTPPANAAFSVRTNVGAACQITVTYGTVKSTDSGLTPKIADEFGVVMWTWSVPAGTTPGKAPVEVTCANESGKSAYFKADLEIVM